VRKRNEERKKWEEWVKRRLNRAAFFIERPSEPLEREEPGHRGQQGQGGEVVKIGFERLQAAQYHESLGDPTDEPAY
jgi:hypothetical protein